MRFTRERPRIVNILYCCTEVKKDEHLKKELKHQFSNLRRQNLINDWSPQDIEAGQDWKKEVEKRLETTHIILLLISPDFIASDYWDSIMKRAIQRHVKGEAKVIFILLRPTHFTDARFSHLQRLPVGGKPVNLSNVEQTCVDIVKAISPTIYKILGSQGPIDEHLERSDIVGNTPPSGRKVRLTPPGHTNKRTESRLGRQTTAQSNNGQTRNRPSSNSPTQISGRRQATSRPSGRTATGTFNDTGEVSLRERKPLPSTINKSYFWEDIPGVLGNIKPPGLGAIHRKLISQRTFNSRYGRGPSSLGWVFFLVFDVGFVSLGIYLWYSSPLLTMSLFFLLLLLFMLISNNRHLIFNMVVALIFSASWFMLITHYLPKLSFIYVFCGCAFFFAMRILLFKSTR